MAPSFYTGNPDQRHAEPARLPTFKLESRNNPAGYLPGEGLVNAVNVALLLGQPLLLTGDPGTGKTQLAYNIAWEFNYGCEIFETKSTSSARDLFYYYDTLGRFHAAQTGEGSKQPLDYITYNALGLAILQSNERSAVSHLLPQDFEHNGPRRSVVLIDEVDKAPRDFPNDLLNEVENMYFKMPELGNIKVPASDDLRPILIITSNSEKHLPEAFLRRCVYYHIPFPDQERLKDIVMSRIGEYFTGRENLLLKEAVSFFDTLYHSSGLRKRPATAELIGWLISMRENGAEVDRSLREYEDVFARCTSALVKSEEDQSATQAIFDDWRKAAK